MPPPEGPGPGLRPGEEADLLRVRAPLGLPVPAYDGRSLPNVVASVLRSLDVRPTGGPAIVPPLAADLDPFDSRRPEGPVLLFVVDGFGWFPFSAWCRRSRAPSASAWAAGARPITTVYPTTTVSALTSLSSGTTPAQHGIVGPNLYLPRLDAVVDVLRMARLGSPGREELVDAAWSPADVSGAPPLFGRGLRGTAISRHAFARTGFNRVLYEGAEFVGYATASDLAHALVGVLGRGDPPPVVFAYWDELDTVQHLRGTDPGLHDLEVDRIAHLLGHVARALGPGRARAISTIVTADHGFVPVVPEQQIRLDRLPDVTAEMEGPLAGDRRSGFVRARPGRIDALEAALARRLPPGTRILRTDDVLAAGLFGPPPFHPELRARVGDLVILPPVPSGLLSPSPRPESRSPEFLGSHSGLDGAELLVPLLRGSLHDLGGADPDGPGQP